MLFLEEAKKISMTARERDIVRGRLVSYMEYHPLHMPILKSHPQSLGRYTKRVAVLFGAQIARFRVGVGAVALLFFITIPVVAEQALPGDTLYAVKVRFNEGVRSQLLFSPYEKMQWETKRVERRIAEARLLVKDGKLTQEKESTLEETVRSHATAFQAQLAELRKSDVTGVAVAEVTLESALDVQSAVLNTEIRQEASAANPNEGNVNGLAAVVREARAGVAVSTDADDASSVASYEPLITRIEGNTTRIHGLSEGLIHELTEAEKAEINERIIHVDADIGDAKKAHEAENDGVAIPLLRDALATTEKLIAFMSSMDLRANVSLDTLVPQQVVDDPLKTQLIGTEESAKKGEARTTELEKIQQ